MDFRRRLDTRNKISPLKTLYSARILHIARINSHEEKSNCIFYEAGEKASSSFKGVSRSGKSIALKLENRRNELVLGRDRADKRGG